MLLRLAFGTWKDHESPTLIAATDEYTIDAWGGVLPDFYNEAVEDHRSEYGEVREVFVYVSDNEINALFAIRALDATVEAVPE